MQRVYVDSSVISAVSYDPETQLLEVEFRSKLIYRYTDVPPEAVEKLLTAKSIGAYFNRYIKPRYPTVTARKRVRPSVADGLTRKKKR